MGPVEVEAEDVAAAACRLRDDRKIGVLVSMMLLFPVVVAFLILESEGSAYLTVVTMPRPVSGWVSMRNSQSRNLVVGNKDDKDGEGDDDDDEGS